MVDVVEDDKKFILHKIANANITLTYYWFAGATELEPSWAEVC